MDNHKYPVFEHKQKLGVNSNALEKNSTFDYYVTDFELEQCNQA